MDKKIPTTEEMMEMFSKSYGEAADLAIVMAKAAYKSQNKAPSPMAMSIGGLLFAWGVLRQTKMPIELFGKYAEAIANLAEKVRAEVTPEMEMEADLMTAKDLAELGIEV